jgi:hypothetical protein
MVFCLPLWAAFPNGELSKDDQAERGKRLKGFRQVVANYRQLREQYGIRRPVRSILALTMADDPRGALASVQNRWITPYAQDPGHYLRSLRGGRGMARYLANARQVSACLHREFDSHKDPLVSGIPDHLDFNGGRPWLIPLSAINGETLGNKERYGAEPEGFPVPAHVELPLLVALCERENALM